ncbi:MAG: tannase/feruloyl esterase family alpha/beta hydrolase, partial [Proteobacteria bacterium]|nr:tannase/feruloyl esterase family alpha/beta hydrolase [Pseudomonadota bacterium]
AGAPPIDLSLVYLSYAWGYRVTHDVAGRPLLGPEELNRLTARAVARCDLDDGVKDGIVGDPMHCRVDPAQLACGRTKTESCLTPFQLEAVRKLYAGPTDSMGVALTLGGLLPSSEQAYGEAYFGKSGDPPTHLTLFANGFRYLFLSPEPGPGWTLNSIDFDLDPKRMGIMESLVDSSNPDLRRFVAAGGKLLIYQGLNDPITARAAIDYYETVERTLGGRKPTQAAVRLFAIPGMNHCSGGVGADAADFLGALETWVEQGRAPDRILTGHLSKDEPLAYPYRRFPVDPARLSFTRPVYPYPLRAMYRGRGDPNDAASFAPVERRQ